MCWQPNARGAPLPSPRTPEREQRLLPLRREAGLDPRLPLGGQRIDQSSVSRAETSVGRNLSPALISGARSKRAKPAVRPSSPERPETPGRTGSRHSLAGIPRRPTCRSPVDRRRPYGCRSTNCLKGCPRCGPTALNTPYVLSSTSLTLNSTRSRTSMICTWSVPSPGTSTSPPRMRPASR